MARRNKTREQALKDIRAEVVAMERINDIVIEKAWTEDKPGNTRYCHRPLRRGEGYVKGLRRIADGVVYEMADIVRISE